MRTREYVEKGEGEGKTLVDAMRDGTTEGMQHFDGELERMIRAGIIDLETALGYASNAGNLRLELSDVAEASKGLVRTRSALVESHNPDVNVLLDAEKYLLPKPHCLAADNRNFYSFLECSDQFSYFCQRTNIKTSRRSRTLPVQVAWYAYAPLLANSTLCTIGPDSSDSRINHDHTKSQNPSCHLHCRSVGNGLCCRSRQPIADVDFGTRDAPVLLPLRPRQGLHEDVRTATIPKSLVGQLLS